MLALRRPDTRVLAWLLCFPLAGTYAQVGGADDMPRFGWLRQLVGACWQGRTADGTPTDTQCYELQYGKFLRGTIAIPSAGLLGDSVWAWDEAGKRITLTAWSSSGAITNGEAYFEGDAVVFPVQRRDGAKPTSRTRWQRIDADSFQVTRQRRAEADWADVAAFTYQRVR
jgi:hypothetical protein